MNRRHFIATVPAVAIPSVAVQAAQDAATGDEGAVRAVIQRYTDAREAKDSKQIEALLTPDADQLVSDGAWQRGRDALVQGMLDSLTNGPARRTITIESVRLIAPDVAIADGRDVQEGRMGGGPRGMGMSITMRRSTDGWRIAAIRNMVPVATPRFAAIPDDADPQVVLTEARSLVGQGKYEEALQRHLWFHENATRLEPSMGAVRLSFALSYWVELGEKYPKAREALVAIRDWDVADLRGGVGTVEKFADAKSINGYLEEPAKTVELFRFLDTAKPKLADRCYIYAEEALAEAGEYELCSRHIPRPEENLRRNVQVYQMASAREKTQEANIPKLADRHFAESACRLIVILVGSGRLPEGLTIQSRALEVRDDPRIRDAVKRAELMPKRP